MNWTITIDNRIKLIQMSAGSANAIDMEFLGRLIDDLEKDDTFDGIVLTGNGRFFSAGLNIVKFTQADLTEVKEVITTLSEALHRIMAFPGPVIAAVNGHAVAGGCLLALSCDYRIGSEGSYKMGVNELALGLDLPPVALAAIRKCVPTHLLFEVAAGGRLHTPEQAVLVGLLNELAPEDQLLAVAMHKAGQLANPLAPFQRLKSRLFETELKKLGSDEDWVDEFAAQWSSAETQQKLRAAVARLKED